MSHVLKDSSIMQHRPRFLAFPRRQEVIFSSSNLAFLGEEVNFSTSNLAFPVKHWQNATKCGGFDEVVDSTKPRIPLSVWLMVIETQERPLPRTSLLVSSQTPSTIAV